MSKEVNTVAVASDESKQIDDLKETCIDKPKLDVSTILKIGDANEDYDDEQYLEGLPSGSQKYFYRDYFKDYYLRKLILQDIPPSTKKDYYLTGAIGLSTYESEMDNTRFLRFYHRPDEMDTHSTWGYEVICGPTISGERILKKMKKTFKNETWTRDDRFLVPFKSKMTNGAARKIMSKCVDEEYQALFNFIVFLHKQHEQKK